MRIDQVVVGASPGDAITEAALRTRQALRRSVRSDLYGIHVHPALEGDVLRMPEDFPRNGTSDDVLIHHVSIGEPGLMDFVMRSPERVVAAYHNITPASFFDEMNPEFVDRLRDGRAELAALSKRACCAVADSDYNAHELREAGFLRVEVAPPPVSLRRLLESDPDTSLIDGVPEEVPVVLVVGQLLPHKRPDLAIDAHHLLNVNHAPAARLFIAGAMRQPQYSSAVVRHVESLRLDSATITGEVSDAQLGALLHRGDVLVVPSEHEGFCVPLLEAMHFGVPIVARDHGAIVETAAGAALMLPADAGAPELCEATARVLSDGALRHELVRRGKARAAHFDADRMTERWLLALARALRSGSTAPVR